jgi:pimeloyl-ACP methyl ester carboxylesterase
VLHVNEPLRELPGGGVLHVEGPPGAPALLFLHGVGGGAWSWRPQRAAFVGAYRLFVWEARGHGAAAAVDDAGLGDYYVDAREALAATVDECGAPVTVVAHSMGGLLAFALARDEAARVNGLFLVDPVYATGDAAYGHFTPRAGAIAKFLCGPLLRSFERDGTLSRMIARWLFTQSFTDRARMEAAWVDQRRQVPFEYPRMLEESFGRPEGFELSDFAREIRTPTTVLEGDRKAGRVRFPEMIDTLRERLGVDFTSETIHGGHYLQLDRPAEVNAHLARFLDRFAPAPAARS